MEYDTLWLDTRAVFRRITGDESSDVWLAQMRPAACSEDELVVTGPERACSWANCRHAQSLAHAASTAAGRELRIRIVGLAEADSLVSQTSNSATNEVQRGRASLNPRYTFDQFVIGHGNRAAHAAALAVAEMPAQAFNPLFLYGPPGLGKTHLLHSIGNFLAAHAPAMTVDYMTAESFAAAFRAGLTGGSLIDFKHRVRGTDVLLVDDIQFLQNKARTEEEFFHTFNDLMAGGRQLVVTADRMPRELTALAQRMRERFESGLVLDVAPPDRALLKTILRKRVAVDCVDLADERALERVAERVPANVRSLEGALIRVCALASLRREPITPELVDEILDVVYPRNSSGSRARTVRDVQSAVCEYFQIEFDELVSPARDRRVARPRQIAMYLACELTNESLPSIAHEFARDHSTVLYARDKITQAMRQTPEVKDVVEKLSELFDISTSDRATS